MRTMRPAIAIGSRSFGKRFVLHDTRVAEVRSPLAAEVRLFAATFLAGFVFMSVFLG